VFSTKVSQHYFSNVYSSFFKHWLQLEHPLLTPARWWGTTGWPGGWCRRLKIISWNALIYCAEGSLVAGSFFQGTSMIFCWSPLSKQVNGLQKLLGGVDRSSARAQSGGHRPTCPNDQQESCINFLRSNAVISHKS
jgi:hypothetical protein